jgi:hypothetical protein
VSVGLRMRFCFRNDKFDRLGICHNHLALDSGKHTRLRDSDLYNSLLLRSVNRIFR